ncbi:MAG: hypothetical protein AAF328_01675 [Planctomycetota bacterium]
MNRLAARVLFPAVCFAPPAGAAVLAEQAFEPSPHPWAYTLDPDPVAAGFHPSLSRFGITDDLGNFTLGSGDFLGVRNAGDLANPHGQSVFVRFAEITLTHHQDVELRFDYRVRDFDPGESVGYELFLNGVSQGDTVLVAGKTARSDVSGSVAIPLPDAADAVSLVLRVTQSGTGDYTGFDNFQIHAMPEPLSAGLLAPWVLAARFRPRHLSQS